MGEGAGRPLRPDGREGRGDPPAQPNGRETQGADDGARGGEATNILTKVIELEISSLKLFILLF